MGTVNNHERVKETGVKRDVNRGFIDSEAVERALKDPGSKLSLIRRFGGRLYRARTRNRAFHPRGRQKILQLSPDVFAVVRQSPKKDEHILALTNVTGKEIHLHIPLSEVEVEDREWQDLLSEKSLESEGGMLKTALEPYGVMWLKPSGEIRASNIKSMKLP